MATFILNQYDAPLDVYDKEERKIFTKGSKGLKE